MTTQPVMSGGELAAFGALTLVALGAVALFAVYWWRLPDRHTMLASYLVATALGAYHLASWFLRWLPLPWMRRPTPPPAPPPGLRIGVATTIVPSAESIEMLELTVAALVGMRVPHDTWVLDEEDDPRVRRLCLRLGARHFSRRAHPELATPGGPYAARTKHGNYNAWLLREGYARYDVIVSFDPDHVPEPDYLEQTVGYLADPAVGYVQAPQVYYNQAASWIARGAAEETYDFYSAHQMASFGLGRPAVIGCHTVHRSAALRDIGGFADHDADDLMETMEYRAAGWRGVYVPEVLAQGLTPTSWSDYMRQQARWARSVLDLKMRVLPRIAGRLGHVERLMELLHGIFYLRPLTIPIAYLLLAWMIGTRGLPAFMSPRSFALLGALAVTLGAVGAYRQRFFLRTSERGVHWRSWILQFAKWPGLSRAAWHALRGKRPDYALTLKVIGPSGRPLVLWPHLAVALLLAEAWVIGAVLEPPVSVVRTTISALIVIGSIALAWTETIPYPPAFTPGLYERARERR